MFDRKHMGAPSGIDDPAMLSGSYVDSEAAEISIAEMDRLTSEERARRRRAAADAAKSQSAVESHAKRGQKRKGGPGPGPGHGHGGHMMPGEKARDFKGTMRKMLDLMGKFKLHLLLIFVFAIGSTVFAIVGPKVMSEATTVIFEGVVAKIAGTGGIDFSAVGRILLMTLL